MVKFNLILFTFLIAFGGCTDKKTFDKYSSKSTNEAFSRFKKEFNPELTNHFPDTVDSAENYVKCNTHAEKNDYSLFLFEYNISQKKIDIIKNRIKDSIIAKYSTKDKCILKVNPFETVVTKENVEIIKSIDSALANKPCFRDKLPVPNFIDFSTLNKTDFWKDKDFIIYVLGAKTGNEFNNFELLPDPQMPSDWKNGYSKGIAINQKKGTVIYWSMVW